MEMQVEFPSDIGFVDDLILQRTEAYLKHGGRKPLADWMETGRKDQLTRYLIENNLLKPYLNDTLQKIAEEAEEIVSFAESERPQRLVSIGPGNAILEMVLFKRLEISELVLIDIEQSDSHQHGFAESGSGYASLQKTRDFLALNGVTADRVRCCNPLKQDLPETEFDLLISIFSMGFHYPCTDYAPFIQRQLAPGGRLVIDKRAGQADPGYDAVLKGLDLKIEHLSQRPDRVFLTRPD